MSKKLKVIYLILTITLNFSCAEKRSSEKEVNITELANTLMFDSLKFTSGIRSIFQDSKGHYWIGSHKEGVSRFDGKLFEYFTTNDGLTDNQIRSIQEDGNGNIWIATGNGVNSFNGEKITNYPTEINPRKSDWNTTKGNLWFNAGTNQGVYRYDGHQMNYLAFPNPKDTGTGNLFAVTGISKGKNKMVWFGTYAGVFGFNGNQFTTINDETLRLKDESEKMHVRSIFEDSQGRLWIGNNGIGVILKNEDSITHFSKEQGKLIPMKEFETNIQSQQFTKNTGLQSVFAIFEDSEGNIWFGDRDSGAWKYDGIKLTNYKIDTKLNSQMIWSIYEDQYKNLIFGMAEGGVYKFNGKGFEKMF